MAKNEVRKYTMVAIGGSAGSLEVMLKIISGFPLGEVSVILVLHRKNSTDSVLQELLAARTKMKVREVEDKEPVLPGMLYLAPPDYHLLLEGSEMFSLDSSEKVHFSRPSIDVCFESAAAAFGSSLIGILLSGANADGALGLLRVREAGGYTIVQDPASAEVGFMPQQAVNFGAADAVVPGEEIVERLRVLLGG